jgi:hypothetical protein
LHGLPARSAVEGRALNKQHGLQFDSYTHEIQLYYLDLVICDGLCTELEILLSNYSRKLLLIRMVLNILFACCYEYKNDRNLVELQFITFTIKTAFGIQIQYLVSVPNI